MYHTFVHENDKRIQVGKRHGTFQSCSSIILFRIFPKIANLPHKFSSLWPNKMVSAPYLLFNIYAHNLLFSLACTSSSSPSSMSSKPPVSSCLLFVLSGYAEGLSCWGWLWDEPASGVSKVAGVASRPSNLQQKKLGKVKKGYEYDWSRSSKSTIYCFNLCNYAYFHSTNL